MKLDRSRPFGEIFGGNTGAKYEQDGMMFDAAGEAIGGPKAEAKGVATLPVDDVAPTPVRRGNKKSPV